MATAKYTRWKGAKITKNFSSSEFDCKGKSCKCCTTTIDVKLVRKLQILRNRLGGKSIVINSGYRCAKHNAAVGGVIDSYHTTGQAADIHVYGVTPSALAKAAQEAGFRGIGMYNGAAGHFVHVDVRSSKYLWINTAGKNVATSTHGGTKKPCPYKIGTATMRVGSRGNNVKAMQWILNWAGYTCADDGIFGAKTRNALVKFQSDMILAADGICGAKTIAVLKEVVE